MAAAPTSAGKSPAKAPRKIPGKTGTTGTADIAAAVTLAAVASDPSVPDELKKRELVEAVAARAGVKKKLAKPVVEAMLDVLGAAVASGRDINLQPFGKITAKNVKDTANARVTMARIRQRKPAGTAPGAAERTDAEPSKEAVADSAE